MRLSASWCNPLTYLRYPSLVVYLGFTNVCYTLAGKLKTRADLRGSAMRCADASLPVATELPVPGRAAAAASGSAEQSLQCHCHFSRFCRSFAVQPARSNFLTIHLLIMWNMHSFPVKVSPTAFKKLETDFSIDPLRFQSCLSVSVKKGRRRQLCTTLHNNNLWQSK